jgi:hypothetical protein
MDYTIKNNAKLFDEVLQVLNIDHMMNCLVLAVHDLFVHPPSEELQSDLRSVIHRFYTGIFEAGSRLSELARQYEVGGGEPLPREEILEEVNLRRGTSRS